MTSIRRKLYRRGSSYETTVPMPLLFALDKSRKHNVIFSYDQQSSRWYIDFEEAGELKEATKKEAAKKEVGKKRGKL
ncbi:hypothetical protein KY359_01760 [Candidatus Woesearchaeota archaeon]|nr:hypothetical protein [Candidatus Woesearchaeota archaeon]